MVVVVGGGGGVYDLVTHTEEAGPHKETNTNYVLIINSSDQ